MTRPVWICWWCVFLLEWERSVLLRSCLLLFCFRSLEQRNLTLETEMMALHEELDQERKKFTMVEIKMRNAERAKEDAEKRNDMLQKEMEQFFSTFGELTVESRRPERGNTIWIQWAWKRRLWDFGEGLGGIILYQVAGHLSEASTQHNVINPWRKKSYRH